MAREIIVYGDWLELGETQRMGLLRSEISRGGETFSFEYAQSWLDGPNALSLDPELRLFQGPHYLKDGDRPNFGIFLDSSPDRWGQLLMKRREASNARREKRKTKTLVHSDFMLGVHDAQRVGGLRFKTELDGEFLADQQGQNMPPWARLRELEHAAWQFQSDDGLEADDEARACFQLLVAPGSSIGGARPKAGVCDEEQNLWIAKFPGRNDEIDVGGWEMVTHQLAKTAGLNLSEARAEQFGRTHHTFLIKRFDRVIVNRERRRRHFASAMTMLGYSDGTSFKDGASYLEIVEFLTRSGANIEVDLHELWRRIVFYICVSNTDDHLRNHGFLMQPDGWRLSPAYDVNPDPTGNGLSLNISDTDNALSLDLALDVAGYFRLDRIQATSIIEQVKEAVSQWRAIASELGIPRREQQCMKSAFRVIEM